MRRLFGGLLCFCVLYALCGCAAFKESSSRPGLEQAQKTQTQPAQTQQTDSKAPSLIPGAAETCPAGSAACLLPTSSSASAAQEKAEPVVKVPETSYDFGIMNEDRDFSHKFHIKNAGTSELIIKKIIPG